jgi:hypothetical protein
MKDLTLVTLQRNGEVTERIIPLNCHYRTIQYYGAACEWVIRDDQVGPNLSKREMLLDKAFT